MSNNETQRLEAEIAEKIERARELAGNDPYEYGKRLTTQNGQTVDIHSYGRVHPMGATVVLYNNEADDLFVILGDGKNIAIENSGFVNHGGSVKVPEPGKLPDPNGDYDRSFEDAAARTLDQYMGIESSRGKRQRSSVHLDFTEKHIGPDGSHGALLMMLCDLGVCQEIPHVKADRKVVNEIVTVNTTLIDATKKRGFDKVVKATATVIDGDDKGEFKTIEILPKASELIEHAIRVLRADRLREATGLDEQSIITIVESGGRKTPGKESAPLPEKPASEFGMEAHKYHAEILEEGKAIIAHTKAQQKFASDTVRARG